MYILEMQIPNSQYDGFVSGVESTWFSCDEPILSHHGKMTTGEYEYASFSTDSVDDLGLVIGMLPENSVYFM